MVGKGGGNRKELLRVVLRDTLNRHGVPAPWIGAEVLASTSRNGEQGLHWRLIVRHWDARLMQHAVAIQQNLIKRVMTFDPLASQWLTGLSWQFALPDEAVCPPMPHPGVWTQPAQEPSSRPTAPTPRVQPTQPQSRLEPQPSGDVIAGPVRIPDSVRAVHGELDETARADLEKLFAVRDADYNRNRGAEAAQQVYSPTEPSPLN